MTNTLTIDLETTIRNKTGKSKAAPFCAANKAVLIGVKWAGREASVRTTWPIIIDPAVPDLIIGQNFKFDIQYIRRDCEYTYERVIKADWWDTSVAEYILTAMQKKYPSLDYLSAKYGGTLKDDKIKNYWKDGVDTTDIPMDLLREYCIHDVVNTELVAHAQIEKAKDRGLYDLIIIMSNVTKAYADMEYNGLHVDLEKLEEVQLGLTRRQLQLQFKLDSMVHSKFPEVPAKAWNLNSNTQLSSLMFGGPIKWSYMEVTGTKDVTRNVEQVPCGIYKSGAKKGQTKMKWIKETTTVEAKTRVEGTTDVSLLKIKPRKEWANDNGYTTSDTVLNELYDRAMARENKPLLTIEFIETILEIRKVNKLISTYCEQLKNLIFDDGRIHHNLNAVSTDTSRLSSSNPNMQNIPSSGNIKSMFTSRYGAEGMLVQVDYSQLEVVWQAFVAGDTNLKQGITDGIDFHCQRLAKKEGMEYDEVVKLCKVDELPEWVEKRKKIKVFTFQRAYGAGAKAIAKSTGMDLDEVKELIANEIEMYPLVEQHFKDVKAIAERSKSKSPVLDNVVGYYRSLTGRVYHYQEYTGKFGTNLSPTQLRNYDIQGGATGDLVPAFILHLFKKLQASKHRDGIHLINTIHDSIMLDIRKELVYGVCKGLKLYMEDVSVLKDAFGIDFDIPLKVDVEYGLNWGDMKSFKSEDFDTVNRGPRD